MKDLASFIPFGAQYYRPPTPQPSEWEKDLRRMKEAGFTTVKYWAMWRWCNPGEDEWYFEDLDRLMDLAEENDLAVVINTILHCAPTWIYEKYPDCHFVHADGRKFGPIAVAWRQIGGAPGVCFNNPAFRHALEFLEVIAERYKDHPALLAWDIWNEPSLHHSLLGDFGKKNAPFHPELLCYCNSCRHAFIDWLKKRYGDISALNARWARNYKDWDEIELPKITNTIIDMMDWRLFFVDVMAEQVRLRTQAIKKHDKEHPVLFHGLCDDLWDFVTSSADFWKMREHVDLIGDTSGAGGPYVADMLRCSGGTKLKWSCEIHAISGKTFQPPRPQTFDSIKYHILIPLMRDSRGFLFWQYRPELHGWETPAWGLVKLDGSPAPQFEYARQICALLQENASFIYEMKFMPKSDIAILFVPEEKIFAWCGAYTEETHHEAVEGIYQALYDGNFNCDFLHPKDVEAGLLSNYKVLFCPEPYWLPAPLLARIREWVEAGGVLISEAYFAGMNVETGLHNTTVPGAGFDKVFGVIQDDAVPLDLEENERAHFLLTPKGKSILPGATEFYGMILYERYNLYEDATPIAQTEDGKIVAALSPFGKGKALAIGTYFGIHHSRNRDTETGDFIRSLARLGGARPHAKVANNIYVRVDLAGNGERTWLLLTNNEGRAVEAEIQIDENIAKGRALRNLFTGQTIPMDGAKFRIRLEKDAVELFEIVQ